MHWLDTSIGRLPPIYLALEGGKAKGGGCGLLASFGTEQAGTWDVLTDGE